MTRLTESAMASTVRISRALREKREETVILETAMWNWWAVPTLRSERLLISHRQFLRAGGLAGWETVDQLAIFHDRHFLREGGDRRLVRDHDNRLSVKRAQIAKQLVNTLAGSRIQIPRRLIGEHDGRHHAHRRGSGH